MKERPFICDICQKTFSPKLILQAHVNIHTKEPYLSNSEIKDFLQNKKSLSRTNEKSFLCDTCLKTFLQESTFKNLIIKSL